MTNNQEWNEFLDNMFNNAIENYKGTEEYVEQKRFREEVDTFIKTELSTEHSEYLEENLFDLSVSVEKQAKAVYRQGVNDCIMILKNLGILADK